VGFLYRHGRLPPSRWRSHPCCCATKLAWWKMPANNQRRLSIDQSGNDAASQAVVAAETPKQTPGRMKQRTRSAVIKQSELNAVAPSRRLSIDASMGPVDPALENVQEAEKAAGQGASKTSNGEGETKPEEPKPSAQHGSMTPTLLESRAAPDVEGKKVEGSSPEEAVVLDSKRGSVRSQTDMDLTTFRTKPTKQSGAKLDLAAAGIGHACQKGLKEECPNQDSWVVMQATEDIWIYGVFDGHGKLGHDVSDYVADTLPGLITEHASFCTGDMKKALADSFRAMQNLIIDGSDKGLLDATLSGTTATVAVHERNLGKFTVAQVGDSSCALAKKNKPVKASSCFCLGKKHGGATLIKDHKPNSPGERERIEKAGGTIVFDGYCNHRVYARGQKYPGLNMSRALGDLAGFREAGISAEPTIIERKVDAKDLYVLLCSDGVWEFMSPDAVTEVVLESKGDHLADIAYHLAEEARDRWMIEEEGQVVDDITVLLINLHSSTLEQGATDTGV